MSVQVREATTARPVKFFATVAPYPELAAIGALTARGGPELLRARYAAAERFLLEEIAHSGYISASRILTAPDPGRLAALSVIAGTRLEADGKQVPAHVPKSLYEMSVLLRPWPVEESPVEIPMLAGAATLALRGTTSDSPARAMGQSGGELGARETILCVVGPGVTRVGWELGVSLLKIAGKGVRRVRSHGEESKISRLVELSAEEVCALSESTTPKKGGRHGR